MSSTCPVLFSGGIGIGEMLSQPLSPARGLQTILIPEPFCLWMLMPWVCPWSFWSGMAKVRTFPLCSWCPAPCLAVGCWDMWDTGPAVGSPPSPCGHHVSTVLLPSHLPWPGADHAAVGARGYFELCSQVLLQLSPISRLGLVGGTLGALGSPVLGSQPGLSPRAAPACSGCAHTQPEPLPHFFGVQRCAPARARVPHVCQSPRNRRAPRCHRLSPGEAPVPPPRVFLAVTCVTSAATAAGAGGGGC